MKLLELDNPREAIAIGCRLLKLFGLGRDERFKLVYWLQCVAYLAFSIVPRLLVEIEDMVALMRLIAELVFVVYLCLQIMALYCRRRQLYRLVDMLQQCIDIPYSEQIESFLIRSNVKINQSSAAYARFFMCVYVLYCTMSPLASGFVYIRNQRNATGVQEDLYDLDIRYNPLHYSIYAGLIFVLSAISSLSLCTKDVIDIAAIKTVTLVFGIVTMQIRDLHEQITQERLNRVIKSHSNALSCATQLEQALNLSVLFQFASCSAIWCLMLFYILLMGLDSRVLSVVLLLVIVSIETYAYCMLGSQLTTQGEDLLMALQQLSWYDQPVPIQRQILLMIRRSQTPLILRAGKLFSANVVQFGDIVQKSYSFFLVLKNVF
ncbi:AGAP009390-PA [Anopheles gambiae str. PEST]|uniref:AGAP009390-PA n=1 Tax=Anopheles gambiae TaxID=7165 RepID=Q7PFK8_ANOGA|nr:AGAP009390-PA [Anopheles gambiae str. PEST]